MALPANRAIPALFEEQVERAGQELAVRYGSEAYSYTALNSRANRLAHAILDRRGPAQEPVVLIMPQGAALIAAILGVVKAGKIYVVAEPDYPEARLTGILDDCDPPLLIASASTRSLAQSLAAGRREVIDVDTLPPDLADDNPPLGLAADATLNIMYTSGSTGEPKGVVQTHGNLIADVLLQPPELKPHPGDRVALVTPFSFGASTAIIFGTLLQGASIFPFDLKDDGVDRLGQWLEQEHITIFHSVPTVYRHLVNNLDKSDQLSHVRLVRLGGEPVLRQDLAAFRDHFAADCHLRISLATTETYLITFLILEQGDQFEDAILPVGHPAPGKEVLILDERRRPLAAGEVGEIAVRSRHLSPGYWQRPEQTAAAFLPGPEGTRLYLTGDLGRLQADGRLQHLGRKDSQVKIRGHRVEIGEVEQALLELESIREAVVVAQEKEAGDNHLVAYVVFSAERVAAGKLRTLLAAHLPDYMLPTAFVEMTALPLLPFGKVNRRALPSPTWDKQDYQPPRTATQAALMEIWQEVLGVTQVGITHDFFELGGQSLLAAEIAARVRQRWQVDLALTDFIEAPTIAAQAELITAASTQPPSDDGDLARALRQLGQT